MGYSKVLRKTTIMFLVLGLSACGSDGGTSTTTDGATTTTAVEGSTIHSYMDAQPAVIQIVAKGTLRDPEIGLADASGAGSGFIISPDGLAVTNNHVVAGAATLEIIIGGDITKTYNATIVGVSECNDLALIDISESEPLPFLDWYRGDIVAGLEVYAAGYPLGDPEFTLTRGIVSKAKAGGDLTRTSSIDHTLEHDANIQPGNSGGPLLSTDGQVVGVNYAGGAVASTTAQFFAIAADLAEPVVEELKTGDFETLGVNGWAVYDAATDISGVWVAGVTPGSPASGAGLMPGDIITSMNGLPIGLDGTFKDYCDVIRTAGNNAIAIEVLRYDTSEILRGEIRGDKPIEVAFSFAQEIEDTVDISDNQSTVYSGYRSVSDDTGAIIVEVPIEWSDIDSTPASGDDGSVIPYIAAAPDLSEFNSTYTTPGMIFVKMSGDSSVLTLLNDYGGGFASDCTNLGIVDYEDPVFTGKYQVWDSCAGTDSVVVVLAAVPEGAAYAALMLVQLTSEADLEVLDRIFQTFNIIG